MVVGMPKYNKSHTYKTELYANATVPCRIQPGATASSYDAQLLSIAEFLLSTQGECRW